jgi:hypothetical protein
MGIFLAQKIQRVKGYNAFVKATGLRAVGRQCLARVAFPVCRDPVRMTIRQKPDLLFYRK